MSKTRKPITEATREYMRQWRAKRNANPELLAEKRAYHRAYIQKWRTKPENRAKSRKTSLERYYKNQQREIDRAHWQNVFKRFGLTKEQYEQIIASQGGGCAICGVINQKSGRRLSIDHCHKSTVVRGVLCESCNVLLGNVEAKAWDWMANAQRYLADHPAAKIVSAKCSKPPEKSNLGKSNWHNNSQ